MYQTKLKLILLMFFLSTSFFGQSYSVNGFVYDKKNGESLIGANILVKGTNTGASTNVSGYFIIPELERGNYKLIISYIGYESQEIDIQIKNGHLRNLEIFLSPNIIKTEEVFVSADSIRIAEKLFSKPVSKIDLSSNQINNIPRVIEADLLRALQTLPGITALSDFSSALYIRGGTPDQNLFLVDGTDVYNPEHAFGIFSTFNTNAIKKVELSKGGFGAEYGGRLSSVMDVTNLDGNRNEFEGVFNLSLLSASTTLQAPLGKLGSISGSFRRTYIDQTFAKWIDDVPDYYFYDGNLKAFLDFDEKNKVSISFFKSQDDLDFLYDKDQKDSFGFLYDWGNTTGSLNWKHIFSPKLFSSFWVTASRFESTFEMSKILNILEENEISDYTFKAALEYYATNKMTFRFGAEHKFLETNLDRTWDEGTIDIDADRTYSVAYTSMNWKPSILWDFEIGLRANYFDSDENHFNLDPRLSIKYRLDEFSSLKLAGGIYHQYLNRVPRLFFASIWTTSDKYTKESESKHLVLGYQREIAEIYEFEIETYYKTYKNIYQFNPLLGAEVRPDEFDQSGNPVYKTTNRIFNRGDGDSYGLEILLRKNIGAVTGWLSYSLSRTNYEFDNINQGKEFLPRHNRSSVVNLVINGDISDIFSGRWNQSPEKKSSRWKLGINFIYASGQPITTPGSAYYINTLPDWENSSKVDEKLPGYKLFPGEINNYNLPAYIRMDLSITYEKDYGSWSIAPYLQIFNIGNRSNVWFIQYEDELIDGKIVQKIEKTNMFPLLPSLGINIKF